MLQLRTSKNQNHSIVHILGKSINPINSCLPFRSKLLWSIPAFFNHCRPIVSCKCPRSKADWYMDDAFINYRISHWCRNCVRFFNGLHLAHVPMSPREGASALDEWLWLIKCRKGLDLEIVWFDWVIRMDELMVTVVIVILDRSPDCVKSLDSFLCVDSHCAVLCAHAFRLFWHLLDSGGTCTGQPPSYRTEKTVLAANCAKIRYWRLRTVAHLSTNLSRKDALANCRSFHSTIYLTVAFLESLCHFPGIPSFLYSWQKLWNPVVLSFCVSWFLKVSLIPHPPVFRVL